MASFPLGQTDSLTPAPRGDRREGAHEATRPAFASRLESVGVALPATRVSSEELLGRCRHPMPIDFERITGVRERRMCGPGETTYSLAIAAARDCLAYSQHGPEDLELIINASISRHDERRAYNYEPPVSATVKQALGAQRALNFDVINACGGMLTGLMVLDDFIRRGAIRRGMVVSGECITHLSVNAAREMRSPLSLEMACLTLGDAGAAVVLERTGDGLGAVRSAAFATHAAYDDLCIGRPCRTAPGSSMYTKAQDLHRNAIRDCVPVIRRALDASGLTFDEIDWFIPHQTSIRAIESGRQYVTAQFDTDRMDVVVTLPEFANTASTSHVVALHHWLREGRFKRDDNVMLLCFASGILVGAVVLTLDRVVDRYGRSH
jgi:3-oxoacyl-[acyl-carrier-protein] synthase-3